MKRILCIIAMVMAVLYLAAGSGVLVFQNPLKSLFWGLKDTMVMTTYPASAIEQLLLVGLPCTVLAALNLAGSHKDSKVLSRITVIFCSVVMIANGLVSAMVYIVDFHIKARIHDNLEVYLPNMSTVNSMFSYTNFFINAALVLLLISSMMQAKE